MFDKDLTINDDKYFLMAAVAIAYLEVARFIPLTL